MSQYDDGYSGSQGTDRLIPKGQINQILRGLNVNPSQLTSINFSYVKGSLTTMTLTSWSTATQYPTQTKKKADSFQASARLTFLVSDLASTNNKTPASLEEPQRASKSMAMDRATMATTSFTKRLPTKRSSTSKKLPSLSA